ncbi:hypothetical protein K5V07_01940 [Flavobacterium sp. CHNK8]|uniref:hypothetical protein n=1 Tax=Flavobacterium sp. CHNK8 TaxID=2871165 RepID=UPI001C8ECECD|nr:hypothetical protein [Flavobacterium sp. CHNK8]QZK89317.1 hypothetical protein K5V07_01940 [Flavobacterium sp. CHNK8]
MNRIIFLIIFFTIISCKKDETKTITFRNCKVEYMSFGNGQKEIDENNSISNQWEFESAKRELALCLCERYLEKPDAEIKAKILEIYNTEEEYYENSINLEFDTILKNRKEVFDPTILLD